MYAEEDKKFGIIDAKQHMVDKFPWMRLTGWLREFAEKDIDMIAWKNQKRARDGQGLKRFGRAWRG